MMSYAPCYEPDAERLFLITFGEIGNGGKELTAKVVRRAVVTERREDGSCKEYNDGPKAHGYRNASWASRKKNALYVEDLCVHAYVGDDGEADVFKGIYGLTTCFKDVFKVEVEQAVHMAKTLTKLKQALEKDEQTYGRLEGKDFAGHLIRVAKALGIKQFLTYDRSVYGNLEESDFLTHGPAYLTDVIDHMIKKGPRK